MSSTPLPAAAAAERQRERPTTRRCDVQLLLTVSFRLLLPAAVIESVGVYSGHKSSFTTRTVRMKRTTLLSVEQDDQQNVYLI